MSTPTTRKDTRQAADARQAAQALRDAAGGNPLRLALAEHLECMADYWRDWAPAAPTAVDRTAYAVACAVPAALGGAA